MTERINLSRRSVLAALGSVGVASAGAGLGTSAYFSDRETFDDNTIVAGEGDLLVDWQQTASQSSTRPINAYPDPDGDGVQSMGDLPFAASEGSTRTTDIPDVCGHCGDAAFALRQGDEEYCVAPIEGSAPVEEFYDFQRNPWGSYNLDVQRLDTARVLLYRERDTGDVYLVFVHDRLHDSDGGDATYEFEGLRAATGSDDPWLPAAQDDPGDVSTDSYSADRVEWHWSATATDGGVAGPLAAGAGEDGCCIHVEPDLDLGDLQVLDGDVETAVDLDPGQHFTLCSDTGLESGSALSTPAVFQSEQAPDQQQLIEMADVKPGDSGRTTFSLHTCDMASYLWFFARNYEATEGGVTEPEADDEDEDQYTNATGDLAVKDPDPNAPGPTVELATALQVCVWYDADCDGVYDDGPDEDDEDRDDDGTEVVVFEGSLAAAMDVFTQTNANGVPGVPLDGDTTTPYEGIADGTVDDGVDADRDCFAPLTTVCLGVEWWLPVDHANEVQSDGVSFDLGFYVEQCSANDGSGAEPEQP